MQNERAEQFQKYLNEEKANFFNRDEIQNRDNTKQNTVVFHSLIEDYQGNTLPMAIIFDASPFILIRTQLWPDPLDLKDEDLFELLQYCNELNGSYKIFRFYLDERASLLLDIPLFALLKNFQPEDIRSLLRFLADFLASREEFGQLNQKLVSMLSETES